MKTKIAIVICTLFILTACKKKVNTKDESNEVTTEQKLETKANKIASEDIKDCDDFLDTFETWTDDLITIMAKHKDDPVTLAMSPEYINTMMEGVNFMQGWQTISVSCATDDSYEKRMKAIQKKMEDKQKELGFKN
jgi:hypothetical protein